MRSNETNHTPLLDVAGASRMLGTTERHVRNLVYRRQIPYVKVGGLLRFKQADLDRWIDANRTDIGEFP